MPPRQPLVLAVDDSLPMLEVYRETLERVGIAVDAEHDPRRALGTLQRGPAPALLLLDLRMDALDGLDLLRLVRPRRPDLPVLVVTGYLCGRSREACRELGVARILRKPFDPADLVEAVTGLTSAS